MKLRCSPYNPVYFVVFLGILMVCLTSFAHAQCQADFTYQSYSSEKKSPSGKIEISLKTSDSPIYTFKVYQVEGVITLVQTRQASLRDKVTIEHLKPSTYFVRIEWGETCYKTIGGLDGIIITAKDQ